MPSPVEEEESPVPKRIKNLLSDEQLIVEDITNANSDKDVGFAEVQSFFQSNPAADETIEENCSTSEESDSDSEDLSYLLDFKTGQLNKNEPSTTNEAETNISFSNITPEQSPYFYLLDELTQSRAQVTLPDDEWMTKIPKDKRNIFFILPNVVLTDSGCATLNFSKLVSTLLVLRNNI